MNSKQTFTASQALDLILRLDYSSSETSSSELEYDTVSECQLNDLFLSNESEIEFEGSEVTVIPDTPQKQKSILNSVLHKNIYHNLPKEKSHKNENLHIEYNFESCNTILGPGSSNPPSVSSCSLAVPTPDSNYLHDPSTTTVHKPTTCLSVHQHDHDSHLDQHVP